VPNLVPDPEAATGTEPISLPGEPGKRLVCVANFRPQKDHPTLLRAMTMVQRQVPGAHLLLIGDSADPAYVASIRQQISELHLDPSVSYMGPRKDVSAILRACDIGVLSSASEGLPLALLEYGNAGLAAVATTAGQCGEVLNHGDAGVLVPPASPDELGRALVGLLNNEQNRLHFATRFQARVEEQYSPRRIMGRICEVYNAVLSAS